MYRMTTSEVSEDKMEVLFSAEEISARVREMGAEITRFYKDKPLTVVVLASGGIFFGADIMRAIDLPMWVDCLGVASYVNDKSSGEIRCRSCLKLDCKDRHVLIVDEVLDTGKTLFEVKKMLLEQVLYRLRSNSSFLFCFLFWYLFSFSRRKKYKPLEVVAVADAMDDDLSVFGNIGIGEMNHDILPFQAGLELFDIDVGNLYAVFQCKASRLCRRLTRQYCGRYDT